MKFGIHIGHMGGPLGEMRKLWKFADAKGFDWFSVSDHFQESPPRGGDLDCYEAIATLTAAAMDTTRIRLGSGVYCVAYRNPGLLAKSLTTIDHLVRRPRRLRARRRLARRRGEGLRLRVPIDRPARGHARGVRADHAAPARPRAARAQLPGQALQRVERAEQSRSRSSRGSPSGSAAAARSARCAPPRGTPTGGTAPTSARTTGSTRAPCWISGARRKDAIRRRSCARVNLGFYLGADAKGAARADEIFRSHWGGSPGSRRPHGLLARNGEGRARNGRSVPRARLHPALHRVPRGPVRLGRAGGLRHGDRARGLRRTRPQGGSHAQPRGQGARFRRARSQRQRRQALGLQGQSRSCSGSSPRPTPPAERRRVAGSAT